MGTQRESSTRLNTSWPDSLLWARGGAGGMSLHPPCSAPAPRPLTAPSPTLSAPFPQILIATSELAWGNEAPAKLVIIKGTESADPATGCGGTLKTLHHAGVDRLRSARSCGRSWCRARMLHRARLCLAAIACRPRPGTLAPPTPFFAQGVCGLPAARRAAHDGPGRSPRALPQGRRRRHGAWACARLGWAAGRGT